MPLIIRSEYKFVLPYMTNDFLCMLLYCSMSRQTAARISRTAHGRRMISKLSWPVPRGRQTLIPPSSEQKTDLLSTALCRSKSLQQFPIIMIQLQIEISVYLLAYAMHKPFHLLSPIGKMHSVYNFLQIMFVWIIVICLFDC